MTPISFFHDISFDVTQDALCRVGEGKTRTHIQLFEKEITAVESGCPCGSTLKSGGSANFAVHELDPVIATQYYSSELTY